MLESRHSSTNNNHYLLLEKLTPKQQLNVKGTIIDANNRLNRIFLSFDSFNPEFSPRSRLIDIYHSHLSFYSTIHTNNKSRKVYFYKLNKTIL